MGTLLLPDGGLSLVHHLKINADAYYAGVDNFSALSLVCSSVNSALAPVRSAVKEVARHGKLTMHIWESIKRKLLTDNPDVSSAHSTYFRVVCNRNMPLFFNQGPVGEHVLDALNLRRLLHSRPRKSKCGRTYEVSLSQVLLQSECMSLLVSCEGEPAKKMQIETNEVDGVWLGNDNMVQLFPLSDANISSIADQVIKARHPWDEPEVFSFYRNAFVEMPQICIDTYADQLRDGIALL